MSYSRSMPKHTPELITLSIGFGEVLSLLKSFLTEERNVHNPELVELLQTVVIQYFDVPVTGNIPATMRRYEDLMHRIAPDAQKRLELEHELGSLVVSICKRYLPYFRSYLDEDCLSIQHIVVDNVCLKLTMTQRHFRRFTTQPNRHDNPFSS